MLPSRPAAEGPLAHAIREALESALSPAAAQHLLDAALRTASLERIPQEIDGFVAFCQGPFRRTVQTTVALSEAEPIFDRVGYVLWMATGDPGMADVARSWSSPESDGEDSGVHSVDAPPKKGASLPPATSQVRGAARARPAPSTDEPTEPGPKQSGTHPQHRRPTPSSSFATAATLGRMPAVSKSMPATRGSVEIPAQGNDPRSEPHTLAARAPSAVILISLDAALVSQVREGMTPIPVRTVNASSELVPSLIAAGDHLVVLIDTALPSIAIPTFAGLIPLLPAGTRVVLWGASDRHLARLASMYPDTAAWIATDDVEDPVAFLGALP